MAEIPKEDFPAWEDDDLTEPIYAKNGVLLYRVHAEYNGYVNFIEKIVLANRLTRAAIQDEYVESWQEGSETVFLSDIWNNPPDAHLEIRLQYFSDYQNNFYLTKTVKNLNTSAIISVKLLKFTPKTGPGQTVINGTDGNDTLTGTNEDDLITGGPGQDVLNGGPGSDTYYWNFGDGRDTIHDNEGTNILELGAGVLRANVYLARTGANYKDLAILMPDGGSVTVSDWFTGEEYQLSDIRFGDGGIWTREQINETAPGPGEPAGQTINGTSANDALVGTGGADTISGLGGADSLTGNKGPDRLEGGSGNDMYYWGIWDGNDIIYDSLGTNVLVLGGGIEPSGVKLTRAGTSHRDAVFIMPSGERITVERWYSGSAYQLAEIRFADGTVWSKAYVNALSPLFEGTDGSDTLQGSPGNDIMAGRLGNDRLEGGSGGDTYIWNIGDGEDIIYDSSGSNVLLINGEVNPADLSLSRSGSNLIIEFNDALSGKATVEKWYSGSAYQLAEIRFEDGTVWSKADITAIAAGKMQPFSSSPSFGSGRSSRVANENDPVWMSIEDWEKLQQNQIPSGGANGNSGGGAGGGCDAGTSGLIAFGALLMAWILRRRGESPPKP
jgi:uncharacterized protein (TIGR03382 family)